MKIAFLFPGQGSQSVGMGKNFWENFPEIKSLYDEASSVLGYDLAELSFRGPAEELNKTCRTQPAIVAASIAAFRLLEARGIAPSAAAGHSLGEYSAITAAGVVPFAEALKLTEKRGTFMQEAVPEGRGLMAAVMGLERKKLEEVCASVASGYVRPANYNCPGQIVIAGEKTGVEEAIKLAKESGAKRAVALAVSVPSHCGLMAGASERLALLLDRLEFKKPRFPLVNNADAEVITEAGKIKSSLIKQLTSPLLWEDSVRRIVESGIDTFVEVGPGKVLSGLVKRIEPSARLFNVEDVESLDKTVSSLLI